MLGQNVIDFYKRLYATYKMAPAIKKKKYLSSYSPLNEGHSTTLTNSMLLTSEPKAQGELL